MIDLHVHTSLCGHAEGEPAEYLEVARRKGVATIAFSDHLPLLDGDDHDYAMGLAELPGYVDAVRELQSSGDVEILLGIEADWMPGRERETAALLDAHPFDVVLGSVHFLDGWAFDDPRHRERYGDWSADELYARYFDELIAAAESRLFDVMAHIDLVKKFGFWPEADPTPLFRDVAAALADAGVAVEVSTAGLRKPCGEIYPGPLLLECLCDARVPLTISSDAHRPEEVAHEIHRARDAISSCGYDRIVLFRARERVEVPLWD